MSCCGDINGDGQVDVLDVVQLVGCILDGNCQYNPCVDMDSDGTNNIQDIVQVIDHILIADGAPNKDCAAYVLIENCNDINNEEDCWNNSFEDMWCQWDPDWPSGTNPQCIEDMGD